MNAGTSATFCGLALMFLTGCDRMISSGPIITGYRNAECIPVHLSAGPGPARGWDYSITTPKGISVRIFGAQLPGGSIELQYKSDGAEVVAANAGDYLYPADVRFDKTNETLYVKASGVPAAFGGPQWWLFAFDLAKRKQIDRQRVDPSVLPKE